jgi:hypothetical protein
MPPCSCPCSPRCPPSTTHHYRMKGSRASISLHPPNTTIEQSIVSFKLPLTYSSPHDLFGKPPSGQAMPAECHISIAQSTSYAPSSAQQQSSHVIIESNAPNKAGNEDEGHVTTTTGEKHLDPSFPLPTNFQCFSPSPSLPPSPLPFPKQFLFLWICPLDFDKFAVVFVPLTEKHGWARIARGSTIVLKPRPDRWWIIGEIAEDDEKHQQITYVARCPVADCDIYLVVPYKWLYEGVQVIREKEHKGFQKGAMA